MISFKIDTSEVDNWLNNQSNRKRAKKKMLVAIGYEGQNLVQDEADKVSTTGQLENSIENRVNDKGAEIWGSAYGDIALETGRKPGRMSKAEMRGVIRWSKIKLNISGGGLYVVPRAIIDKIEKQGTEKYRRGGPKQLTRAFNKLQKFVDKELVKFLNEVVK